MGAVWCCPDAIVPTHNLTVKLKPGHAVKRAGCKLAEIHRWLLKAPMVRIVVAGVEDTGIRMPIKAHRIAQTGSKGAPYGFGAALVKY